MGPGPPTGIFGGMGLIGAGAPTASAVGVELGMSIFLLSQRKGIG
jgi:hypothetical protein